MNREELEQKLEECAKYLQKNNIDIIFKQEEVELYRYDHKNHTTIRKAKFGNGAEHIEKSNLFAKLRYLLSQIED